MSGPAITFGPHTFDPASGSLHGPDGAVPLGQRAAALLQALIDADGQTATKSALLEAVWPGIVVEEGNLTVQMAALRKALGQRTDGQDWIVTVPRAGYRLVRGEGAVPPAAPTLPVLVVLPFANLGGDPEQEYFADGVVEDIITALSRFSSFTVISRSAAFAYKGKAVDARRAAAELGVRYVLDGSIRRAGDRLRITAQLIDGSSGVPLWASNFDGVNAEIFDFQDRIAESVANLVEPRIQTAEIARARRERPGSLATYDVYLQALALIHSETIANNAAAHALLASALESDPASPLLLTYASWVLEHRISNGWPSIGPDDVAQCAGLARRGIEQARDDALLLAICGMSLLQGARDYDAGMAVIAMAYQANPNNLMIVLRHSVANLHCGDLDVTLACARQMIRLSPGDFGSQIALCLIADVHLIRSEFAEAIDWANRSQAVNMNFQPSLWVLIAANAHLGRMDEARRCLKHFQTLLPDLTIARLRAAQPDKLPERMANIYAGLRLAGMPEG